MQAVYKRLGAVILVASSIWMTGCSDADKYIMDENSSIVQPGEPEKPVNPTPAPTSSPIPIPTPVGEWQSNLSVAIASANLKNDSATFGQKKDAKRGIDRTDLKAMAAPNWGQNMLEVVFEMDGKEFNTVFQNVSEEEVQKTEFLIRTNKEGRAVTISCNGIAKLASYVDNTGRTIYTPQTADSSNKLLERMKLVDTVTKAEIPFVQEGKLQSYSFTMDNNEKVRKFAIILDTQKVTTEDYSPSPRSVLKKRSRVIVEEAQEPKPELNLDAPLDAE